MCVTNTSLRRLPIQPISLRPLEVSSNADDGQRPFQICSADHDSSFLPMTGRVSIESSATSWDPKPRSKRRRKPQKPGLTAKNQERHFVVHDYHDHAGDTPQDVEGSHDSDTTGPTRRRGGIAVSFPSKLHALLDQIALDGYEHVISWQPHGRAFAIHQPKIFTEQIMPNYFRQSKLTSFQRQLNLYGFQRLTRGADAGAYYCELFLRGKAFLCQSMMRTKVKGTRYKSASSPEQEPNFYDMPPVSPDYSPLRRKQQPKQEQVRSSEVVTSPPPSSPVIESTKQAPKVVHFVLSAPVSAVHQPAPTVKDAVAISPSMSFDSFDNMVSPESSDSFESIPWEQDEDECNSLPYCLSDSDMESINDATLMMMDDVDDDDSVASWNLTPMNGIDQMQAAALASGIDDNLDELFGMLLDD